MSSGLRITWLGHSTLSSRSTACASHRSGVRAARVARSRSPGRSAFIRCRRRSRSCRRSTSCCSRTTITITSIPPSMRELAELRVPFVTSLGVGARLERSASSRALITELDWWETHTVLGGASVVHRDAGAAFLGTRAASIETGRRCGRRSCSRRPSAASSSPATPGSPTSCSEIGRRFGPFDVSMIEIGAWHPAWGSIHLGPANALRAFDMLGGGGHVLPSTGARSISRSTRGTSPSRRSCRSPVRRELA